MTYLSIARVQGGAGEWHVRPNVRFSDGEESRQSRELSTLDILDLP